MSRTAKLLAMSPKLTASSGPDDRSGALLDVAAVWLKRGFIAGWVSALSVQAGALWVYYRWPW